LIFFLASNPCGSIEAPLPPHDPSRRRDRRRIDALHYVFEGAMSGAILSGAAIAFGAWLFFEIANWM